jgi:hypothetical protein
MCIYLMKFSHWKKNLLILGLDPDPESDPNPHSSQSPDPDPHIMNADPKHCLLATGATLCFSVSKTWTVV